MEATHLNSDDSAFKNPNSDRRTSQRARKVTQFFAQDSFERKVQSNDLNIKFSVLNSLGIQPLLTLCSFKAQSACPLSQFKRKMSKVIGLNQNKAKIAYYDILTQRWKQVKSFSQLSSMKDVKIRLFYAKDKKTSQKVTQIVAPTKPKTMYIDQMTYIPLDYYSSWYMYQYMSIYSPYALPYVTMCGDLKSKGRIKKAGDL